MTIEYCASGACGLPKWVQRRVGGSAMKRRKVLIVAMIAILLLTGCGRQEPAATPTVAIPKPTATVEPRAEPEPTATTEPTDVPEPTATTEPTDVPEPTATIAPSATPMPTPTTEPTEESLGEEIEQTLELNALLNMEMLYIPGMAIGIVKNGQLAYAKGFGVLNIETQEPVEATSLFQLGSVSSMFVATAIMQLVERGDIDLDAPVIRYLPDFQVADERYPDITIRHLLLYTSGIPTPKDDLGRDDLGYDEPEYDDGALERFVDSLRDTRMVNEGLGVFNYDQYGHFAKGAGAFDVLGHVIAVVSGQTFEDYMKEKVLDPLGMRHSTFLKPESSDTPVAAPHVRNLGKLSVSSVYPYNRAHGPSIGLHSNVLEMSSFAIALLQEGTLGRTTILQPASVETILEPQVKASTGWGVWQAGSHAGLGCMVGDHQGIKIVVQGNYSRGLKSLLALLPEKSIAVVVLFNSGIEGGTAQWDITREILDMMLQTER